MRKTWVKRENIYYKPFYKQKYKILLLLIFLLAIIFFTYEALTIGQLQNVSTPWTLHGLRKKHMEIVKSLGRKQEDDEGGGGDEGGGRVNADNDSGKNTEEIKILRGIRLFDYNSYKPNFEGKFQCLDGSKSIPFKRVNDDYCDCLNDGSDEPSTNACSNGRFYCKFQMRHITGRGADVYVLSSRINDGVCDCCDGSDEWTNKICKNKCK